MLQKNVKADQIVWSDAEKVLLQSLSIRNLPGVGLDSSNRYQLNPDAIKLGKQLFFDTKLSSTGTISCASCHQPDNQFIDGKRVALAVGEGTRNTPSLLGASHQQWFFWDGRKDSAWSQALEPLENPVEHNLTRIEVIKKVLVNPEYKNSYRQIFTELPSQQALDSWPSAAKPNGDLASLKLWKSLPIESRKEINRVFSNIGKSLAAYETTLKFPVSRFDGYLDSLKTTELGSASVDTPNNEPSKHAVSGFTDNEKAGLQLFIGKAACVSCHHSPLLSSQHFQNVATGIPGKDTGRAMVAEAQRWDVFNCLGEYSDAPKDDCKDLTFMKNNRHELSGSFKVPSLRNVINTAPYMHDGRYQSLAEAVKHYANPPDTKLIEHHMPMITLDEREQKRLVDFLKTL
ncbi:cytochrome-c peroxidase [Leucothrix arctica]|nr:cytochrome c peroxidase [Leucothrix arctica]